MNTTTIRRKRRSGNNNGFFSPLTLKRQSSGKSQYSVATRRSQQQQKQQHMVKKVSTKNPYNHYHHRVPSLVATFHRDEIVTGVTLILSSEVVQHHHHVDCANNNNRFQYRDVCGIDLQDHSDTTEGMTTDGSSTSSHDEHHDDHYDDDDDDVAALHHRQFPSVPTVAADEEEAREAIQAQVRTTTGTTRKKGHKKPLHKYMIKQIHTKCSHPEQAWTHLKNETNLLRKHGHKHYNLLTLRGTSAACHNDNSTGVIASGAHFMLTDRISETLGQRLQRWKDQANALLTGHGKETLVVSLPKAQVDTTSLSFRMKLVYAENLANVLTFLHSKKIAIRNLCPESIGFLASDDTLQLMDLGQAIKIGNSSNNNNKETKQEGIKATAMLAQQNEHALFQMTPGGQPYRYMAPELLTTIHDAAATQQQTKGGNSRASYSYTTSVDCYSWAMIVFEMITLHQPFGKMMAGQHLKQVGLRNPSLRPQLEVYKLPKAFEGTLKGAWRQDGTQRLEATVIDKRLQQLLLAQLHNNNNSSKSPL